MSNHVESSVEPRSLARKLARDRGVTVESCYQCAKCSGGCPAAVDMDRAPSQVLRLLQFESPERDEQALRSRAIWSCIGCETCVSRCPQEVDLPAAMDFLRQEALQRGLAHPDASDIVDFHKAFLKSVEKHGRVHELGMVGDYKLRTGRLFQDIGIAPSMLAKGKLGLFPHRGTNRREVAEIFARVRRLRKGETP